MKANEKPLITERKGSFYLRKSFGGVQREVSLGKDKKIATSRGKIFLTIAQNEGYEAALANIKGKPKFTGTIEEIEEHYRGFCKSMSGGRIPLERTIKHNVARLKLIMSRANVTTIKELNKNNIPDGWFKGVKITPATQRTYYSAIRAARSIFSIDAMDYYHDKQLEIENPFKGIKIQKIEIAAYCPVSPEVRERIFKDCQTELHPHYAMIPLLALFVGLRRNEIEGCALSWFTNKDKNTTTIEIKESKVSNKLFIPKGKKSGIVPFDRAIFELLLELRGNSNSPYFVPRPPKAKEDGRLLEPIKVINKWLRKKGVNSAKPLQDLRREFGSHVYKTMGLKEAATALRNTVGVCSEYYAGTGDIGTIKVSDSFTASKSPEELLADKLGIPLDELLEKLKKD